MGGKDAFLWFIITQYCYIVNFIFIGKKLIPTKLLKTKDKMQGKRDCDIVTTCTGEKYNTCITQYTQLCLPSSQPTLYNNPLTREYQSVTLFIGN